LTIRPEYLPAPLSVLEAAERWHSNTKTTIEEMKAAPAASLSAALDSLDPKAFGWLADTLTRLCNHLFNGQLTARYFVGAFGEQLVPKEFWSLPGAETALVRGADLPFEQRRVRYQLFLLRSEFDALFKRPLPNAQMSALVAALREHADKPSPERRKIVRQRPKFREYHITDDRWREAERQAPGLRRGRRPKSSR
jgi:hypothetical protein